MQANSYVSTLKNAPLLYPDLCKSLYDGAAATGVSGWGHSSKKSRTIDLSDDLETFETRTFLISLTIIHLGTLKFQGHMLMLLTNLLKGKDQQKRQTLHPKILRIHNLRIK